jgi:protocatechuate 3,4-dioxygenase beta subunit
VTRIPDPDPTPDGPAYEGRLLARADEEVVDQGAAFDIGTLLNRRAVLAYLGAGIGSVALAACTAGATASGGDAADAAATGEIPDETAGPYPGDGSNGADVLERSGIVRSDIRSSLDGGTTATGVPMSLTLTILDVAGGGAPFAGAAVYVWHCDAAGGYSMYSDGITEETYLRGVQVAGDDGTVAFASVFPACYPGRWPHIHFEVYPTVDDIVDATRAVATSQVALPADACNAVYARSEYAGSGANLAQVSLDSDMVFGDDGGALQLGAVTGDATAGYRVALTARVDTATAPTAGSAPGGAGSAGGTGRGAGGTPPGTDR